MTGAPLCPHRCCLLRGAGQSGRATVQIAALLSSSPSVWRGSPTLCLLTHFKEHALPVQALNPRPAPCGPVALLSPSSSLQFVHPELEVPRCSKSSSFRPPGSVSPPWKPSVLLLLFCFCLCVLFFFSQTCLNLNLLPGICAHLVCAQRPVNIQHEFHEHALVFVFT